VGTNNVVTDREGESECKGELVTRSVLKGIRLAMANFGDWECEEKKAKAKPTSILLKRRERQLQKRVSGVS